MGIPVVVSNNGIPVRPVDDGWPVMTVADNGLGAPITISDDGAPFVVKGLVPPGPVNLIVNGDFATDTVWTKGDGWSIAGGVAVGAASGTPGYLSQPIVLPAGTYRCEFDLVSRSAGQVRFVLKDGNGIETVGTLRTLAGHYSEDISVSAQTMFAMRKTTIFVGSIDNVELYYLGP